MGCEWGWNWVGEGSGGERGAVGSGKGGGWGGGGREHICFMKNWDQYRPLLFLVPPPAHNPACASLPLRFASGKPTSWAA